MTLHNIHERFHDYPSILSLFTEFVANDVTRSCVRIAELR